jgi:hypothetical protein
VVRSIGQLKEDGTRTPTLLIFDEVWKIVQYYPAVMRVIQKGARTGRRENAVTVLATHTYDDFTGLHDITHTAGVKIIGKQIGDYSQLVTEAGLSENATAAVSAIKNVAGQFTQYVLVIGAGQDQTVEMIMGQAYESVSSTVSGWTAAIIGTGVELLSAQVAADLSNQAERTQAEGAYSGEVTRAGASLEAGNLGVRARQIIALAGAHGSQVASLGQIYAARTQAVMSAQANMIFGISSAGATTALSKGDIQVSNTKVLVI